MSFFLPSYLIAYYTIMVVIIFFLFNHKLHSSLKCVGIAVGLTFFISEFWEIPIFIKGPYGYMNMLNQAIVAVVFVLALALSNFQFFPKLLQLPIFALFISFLFLSIPLYVQFWGWIVRFTSAILLTAWVYWSSQS